jgi:hypothetical protein
MPACIVSELAVLHLADRSTPSGYEQRLRLEVCLPWHWSCAIKSSLITLSYHHSLTTCLLQHDELTTQLSNMSLTTDASGSGIRSPAPITAQGSSQPELLPPHLPYSQPLPSSYGMGEASAASPSPERNFLQQQAVPSGWSPAGSPWTGTGAPIGVPLYSSAYSPQLVAHGHGEAFSPIGYGQPHFHFPNSPSNSPSGSPRGSRVFEFAPPGGTWAQ